jgi:HEAT repeat protein
MTPAAAPDDSWTTEALFERALGEATSDEVNDEAYWKPIRLLQGRSPSEVWSLVAPLADSSDERLRGLVPDVLRHLGERGRPLVAETIDLLREMLRTEQSATVLAAIAAAFVDLADSSAVELLAPFVTHRSTEVRLAVVHGLLPVAPRVVPLLIGLSRDADENVRNWAAFGLGSQLGEPGDPSFVNTQEVRDALADRLGDGHDETRAEAALGLAVRGDGRALPFVRHELERGSPWLHFVEAATALADETLYPALRQLATLRPEMPGIAEALAACRPRSG